jgi:hypothetical protein
MNRVLAVGIGVGVACTIFASAAQAQQQLLTQKSKVTFSQPIEIPGPGSQVLPAGTYTFKLMDSLTDRHIVRIMSADEKHVYATILAVPNYRLKTTNHTVITFAERAAGSPPAIRAWFYPGRNWGQEFVYPKAKAMELATAINEPVLFTPDASQNDVASTAPADTNNEDDMASTTSTQPIRAATPSGQDVPMSDVVDTPPANEMASNTAPLPDTTLPKTASDLPLIALLGLLSVGAGFTLRAFSTRS